jgi:hypothetical protein
MEEEDVKLLTELTAHALKSRCACSVCHRLRQRGIKRLEAGAGK